MEGWWCVRSLVGGGEGGGGEGLGLREREGGRVQ